MSIHEWLVFAGVIIAMLGIVAKLWQRMTQLRDNHFRQLSKRLENIESKLDKHLQWHLEQKGGG